MNEDRVTLEIPHFEKYKQLKDYAMKVFNDILERQVNLVETYLLEFCEVNGVQESELKDYLVVVSDIPSYSIRVVSVNNHKDVKFGVTIDEETKSFEVFGEFIKCKERFPKTSISLLV